MAKTKGPKSVTNKHTYSRISYLYQAATHLALSTSHGKPTGHEGETKDREEHAMESSQKSASSHKIARSFLRDLRAVSLKAQISLGTTIKQSVCKGCDGLLVDGQTCSAVVENESKGARKPWADMLVLTCLVCGYKKRVPVNAPRQKRRALRTKKQAEDVQATG
jgi:ribonuclease P protein subunit RPR2